MYGDATNQPESASDGLLDAFLMGYVVQMAAGWSTAKARTQASQDGQNRQKELEAPSVDMLSEKRGIVRASWSSHAFGFERIQVSLCWGA